MTILFYRPSDPHGCFSNFAKVPVTIWDRTWITSEHAYQAAKFVRNPRVMDLIHRTTRPSQVAEIGRDPANPLTPDWDKPLRVRPEIVEPDDKIERVAEPSLYRFKDQVMYDVCLAKFRQNSKAQSVLLATGDEPLIEASLKDGYWGYGAIKLGQNKLGRILMVVRTTIRNDPQIDILDLM